MTERERLYKQNAEYEEKIEAVKDYLHPLPFETVFDKRIEREKTDAIKEFAERLKKAKQYSYERHENIVPVAVIDWIVEEMVGDTK